MAAPAEMQGCDVELRSVRNIISAVTSVLLSVVGVFGIGYLSKMRENNVNATFSYYSQLYVRLHLLSSILEEYKSEFLDRLLPSGSRAEIDPARSDAVKSAMTILYSQAKETISFLQRTDNQVPAGLSWSNELNIFLELLEDCLQMENIHFYKWVVRNQEEMEKYYRKHTKNIKQMMSQIVLRQTKMERSLYRFSLLWQKHTRKATKKEGDNSK